MSEANYQGSDTGGTGQILAGPVLRRLQTRQLTLWLASTAPLTVELALYPGDGPPLAVDGAAIREGHTQLKAGDNLYFHLLDVKLAAPLPTGCLVEYDLRLNGLGWRDWADADLVYPGRYRPGFVLQPRVTQVLHGSCRKPHHECGDGLLRGDDLLASCAPEHWPALLVMSGDQVYADDVATPMLVAVHQLLDRLQMPDEPLPCNEVAHARDLHRRRDLYNRRDQLLPRDDRGERVIEQLFRGARKPIFTSVSARNHLVSLAEILAMYLLVWSPRCWQLLAAQGGIRAPGSLSGDERLKFDKDLEIIEDFAAGLPRIRRLMAHIPVAMIFDDHDVTDDWNLTAEWEQAAYEHPFSRRIIGNALVGYFICQGWGNAPENFPASLVEAVASGLSAPGSEAHDELVDALIRFPHWHYSWPTQPRLVVLDTRTHRWRSESATGKPSGLMDWEALTDLQQELIGLDAVLMVSPAPIFGVKLIEGVQRLFTWLGRPLMVDAENWMAHRGAAHGVINLFWHSRTPRHFVILSGDVHYSFVYDVELRGRRRGPDIWQITSSGLKNEFPPTLLTRFDRLNRWLYSPRSPLNWLTKRRRMRVIPRRPVTANPGERLLNAAGLGLLELQDDGTPSKVVQLCADGRDVPFELHEDEARWE